MEQEWRTDEENRALIAERYWPEAGGTFRYASTKRYPRRRAADRIPGRCACWGDEPVADWIVRVCGCTGMLVLDHDLPQFVAMTVAVASHVEHAWQSPGPLARIVGLVLEREVAMPAIRGALAEAERRGILPGTDGRVIVRVEVMDG